MIAQVDVTELVVKTADKASEHSWEALSIVIVLVITLTSLAFISKILVNSFIKTQQERDRESAEREIRLVTRVTNLESFVQEKLLKALEKCIDALNESAISNKLTTDILQTAIFAMIKLTDKHENLTQRLDTHTCLLNETNQNVIIETIATKISKIIKDRTRQ